MSARYEVRLFDSTGTLQAIFDDWGLLIYDRKVNSPGDYTFGINGLDSRVQYFVEGAYIEVWRNDLAAGIAPYMDYQGFHRTRHSYITASGNDRYVSYGRGPVDLIGRRIIAFPSGSAGAVKSGMGESVIKSYVAENAGPAATSPPRLLRSGITPGLTIEGDSGQGGTWSGTHPEANLLDTVQAIGNATSVDFDVVPTGPATWEFRTYYPQLGQDRTQGNSAGNDPVVFSLGFGNMVLPQYSNSRINERNRVFVLGQGIEDQRTVEIVEDLASIADSPWALSEVSRNANQEVTQAGLEAVGDSLLDNLQPQESFVFQVLQTAASKYGRDYFLGDLVTANYKDITRNLKVTEVVINVTGDANQSGGGNIGESIVVTVSRTSVVAH